MHTFLFGEGEMQKGYVNLNRLIHEGPEDLITLATNLEQLVPGLTKGP